MAWVDYCIIGIVVLSLLVGLLRGFVRELLGVATWVAAFGMSWFFGPTAAHTLARHIDIPAVRLVSGYALMFFGSLFIGAVITHLLGMLVKDGAAAGIDRMLGGGFGLARGIFVVVLIIMLAGVNSGQHERWWRDSQLIPPLLPLASALRTCVPERWLVPFQSQPVVESAGKAEGS